jgi:hypothetical protein
MTWEKLSHAYPGEDPVARKIFDVLAPVYTDIRSPIYEGGHETTPDPEDVWDLAMEIRNAVIEDVAKLADAPGLEPGG